MQSYYYSIQGHFLPDSGAILVCHSRSGDAILRYLGEKAIGLAILEISIKFGAIHFGQDALAIGLIVDIGTNIVGSIGKMAGPNTDSQIQAGAKIGAAVRVVDISLTLKFLPVSADNFAIIVEHQASSMRLAIHCRS